MICRQQPLSSWLHHSNVFTWFFSIGGEMSQRKAKKELQATDELGRTARVIGSLNFLFILFAFLFQVVLASVLVSIFQCDAVERFGPKYLVAGCLGWPLGRNRSTGAFSQIRIPEAPGRWAPVRGRGCGSAPAGPADPAIHLAQTRAASRGSRRSRTGSIGPRKT